MQWQVALNNDSFDRAGITKDCKDAVCEYIWNSFEKEHRPVLHTTLLLSGKLNSQLAEIDSRATEMFDLLVKQLAEKEGITEQLKAQDQLAWVQRMNNIRNQAEEIVNAEIIYA